MLPTRLRLLAFTVIIAGSGLRPVWAGDIKITFPKHSELTPVQRLNREGVEAIRKHQYDKAEGIFYKAYLYDPADPFTLNNLGYISELQGQLDRAQKFYALATEQGSNAYIDRSNAKQLEGKPMMYALGSLKEGPMRVNRINVEAIKMLSESRNTEADLLLQQALTLDPQNTFTLNNLGVAKEALGDYEAALKYYVAASDSRSTEPVVVTLNHGWKGKPVSEMAAESARRLQKRMQSESAEARATVLTVRGVSAVNRNDWSTARRDFIQAYSLDPYSAFSLNNLGYVAERDGDLETAEFFYERAQKAGNADARVGLATQSAAEGKHIVAVSTDSDQKVDQQIDQYTQTRRQQTGPIELRHRGSNASAPSSSTPPQ
ncbi:tetratricopeptide repeat protein [Alloacidobacterium dinghuense]|uniref:Tetratricopeptide repeat protein n=1 Tax=Alloacidobacterium dinghuense TaxID=2763107 RepID=A0A7G8BKY5_9BACT|nr:tetratricopeptide repeat protein [Alloacidobacterium dinghuense]QNI33205.1 tetratricopeptide repeat protein [Alloacidobacterium dinghuense]